MLENKKTKVSIITITYNNKNGLEKTIKSVIQQNYSNIEYIVIDGKSVDGTLDVLNFYNKKISFWISEADKGISDAFNKGIKNAHGELLYFLNSGDSLVDFNCITKVVERWEKNKTDIITFKVKVDDGIFIPANKYKDNSKLIWSLAELPHQGTFIKRNIFEHLGYYDLNYNIRMDYEFFARCVKNKCTFQYIPQVICDYEIGGKSMQKSNRIKFWTEGMAIKYLYKMKITYKDIIKGVVYKNKF